MSVNHHLKLSRSLYENTFKLDAKGQCDVSIFAKTWAHLISNIHPYEGLHFYTGIKTLPNFDKVY